MHENPIPFTIGAVDVQGNGGDDLFTVIGTFSDGSTSDVTEVTYDGGEGDDEMALVSFSYAKIEWKYTSPSDGKVVIHDIPFTKVTDITYTGLEPITFTGTGADMEFTLTAGADDATLTDNGDGTLTLSGATFEDTTFTAPTNSLTIHGDGDSDILTVANDVAVPSITLDLETVNLGGDLDATTLAGGANTLAVNVLDDDVQIQDAIVLAAAGGTVSVAAGTYAEHVDINKQLTVLVRRRAWMHVAAWRANPSSLRPSPPKHLRL